MKNLYTLIPALLIIGTCLFSYIGFTNRAIFDRYQFQVGQVRYNKQYYRLITSGFLHADWGHLFFNMLTLYFFASPIMYYYGVFVFIWLYLGSIVAGNAFSLWLYKNRPSYAAIGASGGVSGVLFAAIALAPLSNIALYGLLAMPAWIFATLYFAYSVAMLLKPRPWDNIGHAAHLGGAALGMALVATLSLPIFLHNIVYIAIMSLPLLYLAYELLINKKAR